MDESLTLWKGHQQKVPDNYCDAEDKNLTTYDLGTTNFSSYSTIICSSNVVSLLLTTTQMRIIINNAHNILWFLTEGRTGREVCIT
jgi:hypothetical protein